MAGRCASRLPRIALALALVAAAAPTQDHARWIADLGDPQAGEAAERALLKLGDQACKPLERLFAAWPVASPRDVERLRGALRVVDLLGEPAGPLVPALAKHLAGMPPELRLAAFTALGSAAPYATVDAKQIPYDELMVGIPHSEQAALFTALVRLAVRSGISPARIAPLPLAEQPLFVREFVLERLERSGNVSVESLRVVLLDRDGRARTGETRYNGVVVWVEDHFRLRAAAALVALAADDPRSIVGHGFLAMLHPQRAARREALQALTRLGPGIDEALPELLQVAQCGEPEFAGEALKLLLLLGRAVGPHLAEIEALQAHADGSVAKLATSVASRLQAMGFTARPAVERPAAAPPHAAELAGLVAASLSANPKQNLASHVESFYRLGHPLPDEVAARIAELGRSRPQDERDTLSRLLASFGEGWYAKVLGRSLGGGQLTVAVARAYGVLVVGEPASLQELAVLLDHDNVAVRLAAARRLASRHDDLVTAATTDAPAAEELRQRLLLAARADAPTSSRFRSTHGRFTMPLDLQSELQAAAAAALVDCTVPAELHEGLLRRALRHDAAAHVALAVERWAAATPVELLAQIAEDARPEVGKAATAALARRR